MKCPCCGTVLVMTSQQKLVDPTSRSEVVATLQETRASLNQLRKQLLGYGTSADGFSNSWMVTALTESIEERETDEKLFREVLLSFGQDPTAVTTNLMPPPPAAAASDRAQLPKRR